METKSIIPVSEFCTYYNVPDSFIESLFEIDIIDVVMQENIRHIRSEQINIIERMMRLHYQLNINFEGLDVINNLLGQINSLQDEIVRLHNRLDFYE